MERTPRGESGVMGDRTRFLHVLQSLPSAELSASFSTSKSSTTIRSSCSSSALDGWWANLRILVDRRV